MTLGQILNTLRSPTFWTSAAAIAAVVCGALGLDHIKVQVQQALILGGSIMALIPAHHTVKARVAVIAARRLAAIPPPAPPAAVAP